MFGTRAVVFSAKWEHDLDTENTIEGDVISVSLSAPLN
jgi:hypothetical protein